MFKQFANQVNKNFSNLCKSNELFLVDAGDLYSKYLEAFPAGSDPLFRERAEHDCQACKNFIKNVGSVVSIIDGKVKSIWEVDGVSETYKAVADKLAEIVSTSEIVSIFRVSEGSYGGKPNTDSKDPRITWHHFHCNVPSKFVTYSGSAIGDSKSRFQVFNRGLNEISLDHIDTVLDLISSNSLYRGEEFKPVVQGFKGLLESYLNKKSKSAREAEVFVWENINHRSSGFRNTVIGTLLTDLATGDSLEAAVRKFEQKVAPTNYKRPTALITKRMIDDAVAKLQELGLEDSIHRRFAKVSDLSVNDVLYVNNDVAKEMKDSIAALLSDSAVAKPKKIGNAQTVSIDDFMAMRHSNIEVVLSNEHTANFVTVTAPVHGNTGQLFKWNNNFAWSYDGNVTDSIKQRVGKAGGNITNAKLRCSLAWFNHDDLDIHCFNPAGSRIYYGNKMGVLDVDMNVGNPVRNAVENLSWKRLLDGKYKISVDNYNQRESSDVGCVLEVENNGKISQFRYNSRVGNHVHMLDIHVENGVVVKMIPATNKLTGESFGEKWGVSFGVPVKVDTIMLSPNHWENSGNTGNKHWFFILKGCKNPEPVRGIYNEFLCSPLEKHRKVFEVLGDKTKCLPAEEQLSGVGFSSTRKDTVKVIADGRPYVINF